MDYTPKLDAQTTRLAVVNLTYPLCSHVNWPIRLLAKAECVIPLLAVRPAWASPEQPPVVTTTISTEPVLQVGTIDELVAMYREYLETTFNKMNQNPQDRGDLALTATTFADMPSGTLSPLFGEKML